MFEILLETTLSYDDVLQCVAVCCSVLQCVAVCCSVLRCVVLCCSVLQCVAVCCIVLQCVAVCCMFEILLETTLSYDNMCDVEFTNTRRAVAKTCLLQYTATHCNTSCQERDQKEVSFSKAILKFLP